MEKNKPKERKQRPDFCLEGFFTQQAFVDVRHVAANYFNLAHNNFYRTLIYVLTRSGIDLKTLNFWNFKDDSVGTVLQTVCDATFGSDEQKQAIKDHYFSIEEKILIVENNNENDCNKKKSDAEIRELSLQRAEKDFSSFVLFEDMQGRIQKKLFHHIPAFGPIMADVASYEAYKIRQKSDELKDKNKEKILRGITFQQCLETLIIIANALNYYRNFYTHEMPYNELEEECSQALREARLVKYMNNVFKASQRLDKKRELVTTKAMTFLTGHGSGDPCDRMKEIPNGEKTYFDERKHRNVTVKVYRYEENENFFFKIAGREFTSENGGKANYLSDFGKLLFCCLFLKRQQTQNFAIESRLLEFSPYLLKPHELQEKQADENKRVDKENKQRQAQGKKRMLTPKQFTKHDSLQNEIILDMLGIYHIRRPLEKRIDAKATLGTLAMDMLNELRRCPSELYQTFSADDKDIFEREVSDPKDGSPRSAKAEEKVKLIRYTDRFPHLALRYVDETNLIDDIRFHIRLGNYRFHFYDKTCVDGNPKVRSWQKEINGFGKWQEIEENRKSKWVSQFQKREYVNTQQEYGEMELEQPVKDNAGTKPYITDWTAAYNIHTNRIGLYWGLEDGMYLPELNTIVDPTDANASQEELSESERKPRHRAPIIMKEPLCTLSTYDLPALLFYSYLYKHYNAAKYKMPTPNKIIKDAYDGLKAFIDAIAVGKKGKDLEEVLQQKGLREFDIPKALRKRLEAQGKPEQFNNQIYMRLVERVYGRYDIERERYIPGKLSEKLEEIEYRIKAYTDKKTKIDSGDNKYAKKGYADIRHGVLARYLAKSFVQWQPTKTSGRDKGHDKITGLNYSVMTAFLSTYGISSKLDQLRKLLKEAKLIGSTNPHPFLHEVLDGNPQNIEDLYIAYLKQEKKFAKGLNTHHDKLNGFKGNRQDKMRYINENKMSIDQILAQIPFAHVGREKWGTTDNIDKYYNNYANRYHTIMLPDSLFTPPIIRLMRHCLSDDKMLMQRFDVCDTDSKQTLGAAWLIEYYFEHYMKDKHQQFYNANIFKRAYKPFTTMNNEFVKNQRGGNTNELIPYYNNKKELEEKQSYSDEDIRDFVYKTWRGKAKKEEIEILKNQIKDVKDTEKLIRRYRTQDVALFLAAKDLLTTQLSKDDNMTDANKQAMKNLKEKAEHLKLKNFDYDEGFSFLSDGDNPESGIVYTYEYKTKTGRTVKITQKGVSLKNYGNIYRILGDDRFKTLMEGIANIATTDSIEVTFNDLTTEFANYDERRSAMFKIVHELEGKAFIRNEEELKDPSNPVFHIKNDLAKDPRRNNFGSLLELLQEYSDKDQKVMVAIRNAIGHDYYMDITLLDRTNSKARRVPNISLLMEHTLNKKKDNPSQDKKEQPK